MADVIEVQLRERSGTGAARATRCKGMIPGIIYGAGENPKMIQIDPAILMKEANKTGFFSKVFTLALDGKKQQVISKYLQLHPVTDHPLHVDFMRVSKGTKIHVHVPIEFINDDKAPGLKRGGVLNIVLHHIELICPVDDIPEKLTIDITGLEMNHTIHADALRLPKNIVIAHKERDSTLATIIAPSGLTEESSTETAAA